MCGAGTGGGGCGHSPSQPRFVTIPIASNIRTLIFNRISRRRSRAIEIYCGTGLGELKWVTFLAVWCWYDINWMRVSAHEYSHYCDDLFLMQRHQFKAIIQNHVSIIISKLRKLTVKLQIILNSLLLQPIICDSLFLCLLDWAGRIPHKRTLRRQISADTFKLMKSLSNRTHSSEALQVQQWRNNTTPKHLYDPDSWYWRSAWYLAAELTSVGSILQ